MSIEFGVNAYLSLLSPVLYAAGANSYQHISLGDQRTREFEAVVVARVFESRTPVQTFLDGFEFIIEALLMAEKWSVMQSR